MPPSPVSPTSKAGEFSERRADEPGP
jgi:hypothetical protein